MAEEDKEIKAFSTLASAFADLSEEESARVLRWAIGKYGAGLGKVDDSLLAGSGRSPKGRSTGDQDDSADREVGDELEFAEFAELYDACSRTVGVDKVLVAGYWLQFIQRATSFASGPLHDELKNLGHPITNITVALSANIKAKPALVMQVKKNGSSKQARKLYKLTTAGKKRVENWIDGVDTESE